MAEDKGTKLGQATAAVAGALIGAGVGAAATRVLSDKKTRDQVLSRLSSVKDQVMDAVDVHVAPPVKELGEKGGRAKQKVASSLNESQKTGKKTKK